MNPLLIAQSEFSIGESILRVDDIVQFAADNRLSAAGLADTMSVTGLIPFTLAADKAGIKPLVGVRLRIVDDIAWRPPTNQKRAKEKYFYLTVYPRIEAAIKAVFELLTLANQPDHFYYEPRLMLREVLDKMDALGKEAFAVVLGGTNSIIAHPDGAAITKQLIAYNEATFAAYTLVNTPYYGAINKIAHKLVQDGAQPLIVRPALYKSGQADAHEVMVGVIEGSKLTDGWHRSMVNRDMHMMTIKEMSAEISPCCANLLHRSKSQPVAEIKQGIANAGTFADLIDYKWSAKDPSLPKMAPDEYAAVVAECKKGFADRLTKPTFGYQPNPTDLREKYIPRLEFELSILKKLGFSGYFLLVQDVMQTARAKGILTGPGRGSVGGSLVAYLMRLTDCDPIRFNLLFERFISADRIDLPDADLDFMGTRRLELVEFLAAKYGAECVGGISNYSTLAATSAMKDVGKVLCVPEKDLAVSKLIPKRHGASISLTEALEVPEIKAFAENYEAQWEIMTTLEGLLKNYGQHAAGLVVSSGALTERAAVENRKKAPVVCWDKDIVEKTGLIKMDLLGLLTLDMIDEISRHIMERHGKRVDLGAIPLNDKKVLANYAAGKTIGIFQFESGGMRKLLKDLGTDGDISFDDVTAAMALYRPGPMESGLMDSFARRKRGLEAVEYDHPLMEPILGETFGVIVYQEQVMHIAKSVCGFSGNDADRMRKAIGKKKPEEMAKIAGQFINGAVAGFVEVTLEDGSIKRVHRNKKFPVNENDDLYTIEEVFKNGFSIKGHLSD